MTLKDFEDEPSRYIWMRDGKIVYDSIFKKEFEGNLNLLLSCIEDNIYEDDCNINYHQAVMDYKVSQMGMIYIVIDRCVECGDKVDRKKLVWGMCEGCWIEIRFENLFKREELFKLWTLKLN